MKKYLSGSSILPFVALLMQYSAVAQDKEEKRQNERTNG